MTYFLAVKVIAPHCGVSRFEFQLQFPIPVNCQGALSGLWGWIPTIDVGTWIGILAPSLGTRHSAECCGHLGSEPKAGHALSLSISFFASQIIKIYIYMLKTLVPLILQFKRQLRALHTRPSRLASGSVSLVLHIYSSHLPFRIMTITQRKPYTAGIMLHSFPNLLQNNIKRQRLM